MFLLNVNHRAVQLELRRRGDDRVAVRENSNDIGGRQDFLIELLSGVVRLDFGPHRFRRRIKSRQLINRLFEVVSDMGKFLLTKLDSIAD